ncbi:hypothetical protein Nepgr_018846 [Nepenthes gracilis]|uniref:Uncharacterized protein n=1 Tax=Nepenthes gracilis TaxID=150966 RepID=A0AAD3SU71_NEPGR|nr:hypothetical protein Nepgr_018846 [Nepenthes gracilis]
MQFQMQGSLSGVVLFCLGISIGVVSNILANKMEMEKLKELLKQTENLVQDLQEELEMKDSLTLKELVNENDSSLDAHDSSIKNRRTIAHSTQSNSNEAVKYSGGESEAQKTDEKLESMYKIEAELEAELERLELNMKESSLHGLLDVVKLDPDLTAAGMVSRRAGSGPGLDMQLGKNGISPHELSLRLHEVIQSRLEQRILDLEAALGESQQRVQLLELERASYWRDFLRSQSPSSTPGSPMARPLLMNLSGEALDAYCEACEELGKINGFENEDCLFEIDRNNRETVLPSGGQDGGHSFVQNMLDKQKGMANGSVLCALDMEEDTSALDMQMTQQSNEHLNRNMTENEDNNDADDDGNMWLLIKQIVEKARRGSPAILHAQRAMISLDRESTLKEAK